jgi:iron-sulfur cluster assembly accessory protein
MIHLSQAALREVYRLRGKYSHPTAVFRLGVQPGGCSDLHYTLQFDLAALPEDHVWNCEGLQVVVDPQSLSYVDGLTLDYTEDLMGGGFRFHNPGAASYCGCGNSFSVSRNEL